MKKLKYFIVLFILTAVAAFASGDREEKEITIEYWTHEDVNRQNLEDRYAKEFMESHPSVKINISRHPSARLIELVQTAFAAGQGPTIFNLPINDEYPFISSALVAPVDYEAAGYNDASDVEAAYLDGMLSPVIYEGEVYGLPLELTNWSLFINKRVFRDAGLDAEKDYPKTWEEMVEVSEKLVRRNRDILVRRGFDFRYPYYLESLVPMVEQLGGQLISPDGKEAIVGEEAWVTLLEYMQDWGPGGRNLGSPTYKNARSLFNADNNDIGMAITGLYQEARLLTDNPEFYYSGDWMVVPFPVFSNAVNDTAACYYGHYFMVNAESDEATREAAWEFIAYMLSHGEEYLEKVAIIQPTKALMESDTYKNMPYSEVFKNDFERGHVVYYGPSSSEIQYQLRNAVEAVMLRGEDPRQTYLKLKRSVQELLDEELI